MSLSDETRIALETWPEWRLALDNPPTMIRRLSGGLTNQHYLLKAGGLRVVMRVNQVDSGRLGIDRRREQKVHEGLAGKAFAPVIFYCNPEQGVLVTQYIEGRQWQPDDLDDPDKLSNLLALIADIHSVKKAIPPFDYSAHVRNYWQRLCESRQPFPMAALKLYRSIESRLPEFQSAITDPVLCHHDLTPANIIETGEGQLMVLDWEYAGAGLPLVEAIGVSRYWQKPELTEKIMGTSESAPFQQLARDIVEFYELAWPLLRQQDGAANSS